MCSFESLRRGDSSASAHVLMEILKVPFFNHQIAIYSSHITMKFKKEIENKINEFDNAIQ